MPEPITPPAAPEVTPPAATPPEVTPPAKPDSEKTVDELKAEAEAAEAALKAAKDAKGGETEEEIKANYLRRAEKAREKLAKLGNEDGKPTTEARKDGDIDTRDLITLGKHDIAEDSEEAKILAKYKAGGIIESYAKGLEHPGVKAELEALKAKSNAQTVANENDSDEVRLKTKKEAVNAYRASGEVPTDPEIQKAIVDDNLKQMNLG